MRPRSALAPFTARVLAVVAAIPAGSIATYGQVAALAGKPRAARAVGNIMSECDDPRIPCHRVVAAGGRLGGYGDNVAMKRALLRAEGVLVVGTRIKDAARHVWRRAEAAGRRPSRKAARPIG